MANEVMIGPHRATQLLYRDSATGFTAGESISSMVRAVGHRQVIGNFHVDQPAAAGYPRVRQSVDGVNWSRTTVIPRDTTQVDYQYPFAVALRMPYVQIQYTQGGVASTFAYVRCQIVPVEGAGYDVIPGATNPVQFNSDVDTDFTAAITANDGADANLAGLTANVGFVTGIEILSQQNLAWDVFLFGSDTFGDADYDLDTYLSHTSFDATDAVTIANDQPTMYRYSLTNLKIPYTDLDESNELHVKLVPRGGNKLASGAGGDVVVKLTFQGAAQAA